MDSSSERFASRTIARNSDCLMVPMMNSHDGSRPCLWVNQDQMTSVLPVLNKPGSFESPDHLPRSESGKLCHGSGRHGDGNRNPSLKGLALFWDFLPMSRQAFKVQRDGFFYIPFRFFQALSLSMATRQCWHDRYVTTPGACS
jgi:hypothetical protein